jgi:hypothetical protein
MLRYLLLAIGLSLSFMSVQNSASMSRSSSPDASASPAESHRPSLDDGGRPRGPGRSGYIVASS